MLVRTDRQVLLDLVLGPDYSKSGKVLRTRKVWRLRTNYGNIREIGGAIKQFNNNKAAGSVADPIVSFSVPRSRVKQIPDPHQRI